MPFQPIPYSPDRRDTTTMLDLILRRGDIQARGTRNSANAWGDFANTLGQGVQMHFREKERLAKELQEQETKQLDESQAAERSALFNAALEDNPKLFNDPQLALRTFMGIGYSPTDAMAMAKSGSAMVKVTSDSSFEDPAKAMPYVRQMTQGYLEASPELQLQMRPVIEQLAQRMKWDPEENLGGLATEDFNKVMGHYTTAPEEEPEVPWATQLEKATQMSAARARGTASAKAPKSPEPSSPTFQVKQVNLGGETVMANFDSKTGKYYDPDTNEVLNDVEPLEAAALRNRKAAAATSRKAGEALIRDLETKAFRDEIGSVMGRGNSMLALAGEGNARAQYLVGAIRSFAALQPQIHGFRAIRMAADIEELLRTTQNPDTLIATLRGVLTASYYVGDQEPPDAFAEEGGLPPETQAELDRLFGAN